MELTGDSEMKLMLNYIRSYGTELRDALIAKLTCFYNKIILQQSTRLIVLLPLNTEMERAELHKTMFDELMTVRFDPTDAQFWSARNIKKFLYFTHSCSNVDSKNIYVDHGKIFKNIDMPEEGDIVVAHTKDDPNLIRHINKQLSVHCDLPALPDEEIVFYDFSLCFISDEIRADLQKILKKIVTTYPEYVDEICSYAIMSCVTARLKKQHNIKVLTLDEEPVSILSCGLIEDFYTLI